MSDDGQVVGALSRMRDVIVQRGWQSECYLDAQSGAVGFLCALDVACGFCVLVPFQSGWDTLAVFQGADGPPFDSLSGLADRVWEELDRSFTSFGCGSPGGLTKWVCATGRTADEVVALLDGTTVRLSAERLERISS